MKIKRHRKNSIQSRVTLDSISKQNQHTQQMADFLLLGALGEKLGMSVEHLLERERLLLGEKRLNDEDCKGIAEVIRHNTALTTLDLGDNYIGDTGASAIAVALPFNGVMTVLWLGGNKIGDAGAVSLVEGLKHNGALQVLVLNHNQIGNEGAIAIGKGLESNSKLLSLFLNTSLSRPIVHRGIANTLPPQEPDWR